MVDGSAGLRRTRHARRWRGRPPGHQRRDILLPTDICKPTQDGRSYEPWSDYAQSTIKERCRYDIEQRYDGVCSIIFELTVDDRGAGVLDPIAFEGYKRVLSDLEELADETGALLMTLGDYAAAKQIDDNASLSIEIAAPTSGDYLHHEKLTLDFSVSDDLSGVHSFIAEFDGPR